jgi:hypothetical protein
MTTFLTTAQREFLIGEYMEQLEEFDQLEEFPGMADTLRSCNNTEFYELIIDFMPIFEEPGMINKWMARVA